jgi:uncharacterized glyoxalase superfamily protein PhnB
MAYKPLGYTSVSPYLLVRDVNKALAFLKDVFGAEPLRVIAREDGAGIEHAEARVDDSVIMMGETPEGPDTYVHVYVHGVEAAFKRAIEAGGSVVQELKRQGDGDYRGGVADGNGVVWWISQHEE